MLLGNNNAFQKEKKLIQINKVNLLSKINVLF